MRGVRNQLAGQRFGLLTVLGEMEQPSGEPRWLCRCDCGKTCLKTGHDLTRTKGPRVRWVHSCGCRGETAAAIGKAVNRDPLAGYGRRRERKARVNQSVIAENARILRALR